MSYLRNIFIAVDQFGNVLAGGDPDSTISARIGYFANYDSTTKGIWYWKVFQFIINTTFILLMEKIIAYRPITAILTRTIADKVSVCYIYWLL